MDRQLNQSEDFSLPHSAAALKEYDHTAPLRRKLWDEAADVFPTLTTHAQARRVLARPYRADEAAQELLDEAFYKDTKHINSRDHCDGVPVSFIRQLVARYGPHDPVIVDGQVAAGAYLVAVANELLIAARSTGVRHQVEFNGTPMDANPGETVQEVLDRWTETRNTMRNHVERSIRFSGCRNRTKRNRLREEVENGPV